ncbi:MAG: GGDEF domain-containing protein, partial [Candidatus Edwardsbacteria bacterium]|nr:GGDEF domain-containing protein [Candidatus Edwardsbacteria bacterium]
SGIRTILSRESEMARIDPLTGVANRRFFYEWAELVMEQARRYGRPLTVVYLDLDNFKNINDLWGHQEGDKMLMAVAATIKDTIRKTDIVARLGGDEFVILLPEADQEQARAVVDKLQNRVFALYRKSGQPVSFSMGVVTFHAIPDTVDQLVTAADQLMYKVKATGKSNVIYSEK